MQQNLTNAKSTLIQVLVGAIGQQAVTWTNAEPVLWRRLSGGLWKLMFIHPNMKDDLSWENA